MKVQFQEIEEWSDNPRLQDRIGFRWVVYNETFFYFLIKINLVAPPAKYFIKTT
jgi:hypothetical protein